MNRVLHHGVVDQNEAHTLAKFQMDWLSLRKLIRVETPDEPHHIAGEVKNDFASRRSAVDALAERAEAGIRQRATTISIRPISRLAQPWRRAHWKTGPFRATAQGDFSFPCFPSARLPSR